MLKISYEFEQITQINKINNFIHFHDIFKKQFLFEFKHKATLQKVQYISERYSIFVALPSISCL